jgi:hypothetical protein
MTEISLEGAVVYIGCVNFHLWAVGPTQWYFFFILFFNQAMGLGYKRVEKV